LRKKRLFAFGGSKNIWAKMQIFSNYFSLSVNELSVIGRSVTNGLLESFYRVW
jgi:hypothetical protein